MNLLIDALPESVAIADTEYPINSDFRSCLRTVLAFEADDLTAAEKQVVMLNNFYSEIMPPDLDAAQERAIWFLNCGETTKDDDGPRLFSFEKDARFIFAAFKQTHDIDLSTASLHWWKFQAMFMDLGQDTTFCQLVSLRKRIKTGKATKEERAAARDMGDLFDVPEIDNSTLEEREAEDLFWKAIEKGKKSRAKNSN